MPKLKNIDFANLQRRPLIDDIPNDRILFYDIETDDRYAPYAILQRIGVQYGFDGEKVFITTKEEKETFRERFASPDWWKVGFNNGNFDDIVLQRYGYIVERTNWHDCYLMCKANSALLPSYGLKFINWWMLGDHHFPEGKVQQYLNEAKTEDYSRIPKSLLHPYLGHDLTQHHDVFCMAYPIVIQDPHWEAYQLDCSAIPAFKEMILEGGQYIDKGLCEEKVCKLANEREKIQLEVQHFTQGAITNVNSSRQVGAFLDIDDFAIKLTEDGEFSISKKELEDLKDETWIGRAMYRVREIDGTLKFFKAYLAALEGHPSPKNFIPTSFSLSNARTRRATSNSLYGINFQNSNTGAKEVQIIPQDMLGWWFDSTQIENVVHIYESEDDARRRAYESDENWNEYVWLCNQILGSEFTKDELDDKELHPSPVNGAWSVYKQYKTVKLALNFGMGVRKFSATTGVPLENGYAIFNDIHAACPAIHKLQRKVERLLKKYGRVQDVFGHIYSGPYNKAYKVVAYLIQGCGTGSLPKAQIRANWETLQYNSRGVMCGTTHDDNSGRIRLDLGPSEVIATLQELQFNMTKMFSHRFDNIPLRAKLYLSRKNAKDAQYDEQGKPRKEIDLNKPETFQHLLN